LRINFDWVIVTVVCSDNMNLGLITLACLLMLNNS
jgi:hypothetical protein